MADSSDNPDSGEDTCRQTRTTDESLTPGVVSREAIRQRLASAGHTLEDLESKNLLVCFLNEEASDDNEDESDEVCDETFDDFWLDREKQTNLICMEKLSSKTLAKNNISKRKGQIIIPLRCAIEISNSSDDQNANDAREACKGSEEEEDELINVEKQFFDQLASIQLEARRKLRDAKSIAVRRVESERHSQQMNSEIHKMLGIRPGSKLSRSVLTPMTVGQLQFILNYLLSQIEILNEDLVQYLITRDELAIEQDSLLTDIEDVTKCIGGVRESLESTIMRNN